MSTRLAVASYGVRSALSIGIAAMLPVLCASSSRAASIFAAPLFSPIIACVVVGPTHAGVTVKSAALVAKGWLAGAAVTALALAATPPAHVGEASTYATLVLLSLLALYPSAYSPLTQKMAMDCIIVALFVVQAAPGSAGYNAAYPFRVVASCAVGGCVSLAVCFGAPWPAAGARAEAHAALASATAATGALAALLGRAFGEGAAAPGRARLLAARASALRAAAADALARSQALADAAAWEEWLLPLWCAPGCRRGATATGAQRRDTEALLTDLLLAADGMAMSLAAIRAAEAQHAHAVTRARLAALHHLNAAAAAAAAAAASESAESFGAGAGTDATPAAADVDVAPAGAAPDADDDFDRLDALLAPHVASLGAAACAAMAPPSDDDGSVDASTGETRAAHALQLALAGLDAALLRARAAVYYAPSPPSLARGALTSNGPPIEHYMFLLSLRRFASRLLAHTDAPPQASASAHARTKRRGVGATVATVVWVTLRDLFGPFAERPQRPRVLYAVKLVTAVVLAAAAGVASNGSGLWAAITAQIVGARSSLYVGGSLQTASARISGTLLGAMFGYFTMVVGNRLPLGGCMGILAAWCGACACVRVSPRNAYAALVAQFVPFIIVLGTYVAPGDASEVQSTRAYAYARIEQNLIGILCFASVELLVLPQRASTLLQGALADTLRAAAECAGAAWAPLLQQGRRGGQRLRCSACGASHAAACRASLATLMRRHASLLAEAADEPAWMAPRKAAASALATATPSASSSSSPSATLHEHLTRLDTLLSLMHVAAGSAATSAALPLGAPIARLHGALRALFGALACDLDAGANGARTHGRAAACDAALRAFEAAYSVRLLALREEHLGAARRAAAAAAAGARASGASEGAAAAAAAAALRVPPPPIELVMPLDALLFCTRALVGTVDGIAAAVRAYLRSDDAGAIDDDDVGDFDGADCADEEDGGTNEGGSEAATDVELAAMPAGAGAGARGGGAALPPRRASLVSLLAADSEKSSAAAAAEGAAAAAEGGGVCACGAPLL
jgi:hypothetical protein